MRICVAGCGSIVCYVLEADAVTSDADFTGRQMTETDCINRVT
jgi:hypothetical protein